MPENKWNILDLAQDYAEGSELAAAIIAKVRVHPNPGSTRADWESRWLELSDWVRRRDLASWERRLDTSLQALREANQAAELSANELLQRLDTAENVLQCAVFYSDPAGKTEVSQHLAEARPLIDESIASLRRAGESRCDYFEVRAAIEVAQLRSRHAREHFAELSRVRKRTAAQTFLFTILAIIVGALLLHYRIPMVR